MVTIAEESFKSKEPMAAEQIEKALAKANGAKIEGNSVYAAGDYDEAMLKYELAIQTAPNGPLSTDLRSVCYANRAACFSNMGKFEESVKECTKALELNPTYLKALLRRGEAYEKLDQYDESVADITRILALDPGNDQARGNIGRLRTLANKKSDLKMKDEIIEPLDYMMKIRIGNTAAAVAGFGTKMEEALLEQMGGVDFIFPGHEYHAYYKKRLAEVSAKVEGDALLKELESKGSGSSKESAYRRALLVHYNQIDSHASSYNKSE